MNKMIVDGAMFEVKRYDSSLIFSNMTTKEMSELAKKLIFGSTDLRFRNADSWTTGYSEKETNDE